MIMTFRGCLDISRMKKNPVSYQTNYVWFSDKKILFKSFLLNAQTYTLID